MNTTTSTGTGTRAGRREWIGLAVLALPTLLLSLDMSVLYLALPMLSTDLGASVTQQLWITDIYGFMIAGFLITMGRLGDRIGRRRLLLIGATAFGIASVVAAYSTSPEMLILARAALGIAGATQMPSTLALLSNMFTDARQRGVAIAVWMSCFMGGAALGPVIGGAMLASFWWGAPFLLGVPVMVVLLIAGPILLPEYRNSDPGRLDLVSVGMSLAAILPVIYGLKELAKAGWSTTAGLSLVVGIAFGVAFARRQGRLEHPLLELRLFRNGTFSAALALNVLVGGIQGAAHLFMTQHLQLVDGLTPLESGLWMIAPSVAMIAASLVSPSLALRIRRQYVIAAGLLIGAAGFALLTTLDGAGSLAVIVVGAAVIGLGVGMPVALGIDLIVGSVPPEKAGAAASLSETSAEFGIAFGLASLGSLGTVIYRDQLQVPAGVPDAAADTARESLAGATVVAHNLPGSVGGDILSSAREAFTSGLTTVASLGAVLYVGLAVLALVAFRRLGRVGGAEPEPAATESVESVGALVDTEAESLVLGESEGSDRPADDLVDVR